MIPQLKTGQSPVPFSSDNLSISALVVDDSTFDRIKIRRLFSATGLPLCLNESDTLKSLESVLDQQIFDIILVDYSLPDSTEIDALKVVQDHPRNSNAATIMITGYDQSDIAVRALKMGCTDYISKGQLSTERLRQSVLSAIKETEMARNEGQRSDNEIEDLTRSIMTQYSKSLQPELAGIVRALWILKASKSAEDPSVSKDVEKIERRCICLWSELARPGRFSGSSTLKH